METILDIRGISKVFGETTVVDDVSFQVHKGEIMGILGPNGAGKSTVIRSIMGIIYPDSGEIEFKSTEGRDIPKNKIGYLPEERGLYKNVKVMDILMYLAGLKKYPKDKARKRIQEYFEKFDLTGRESAKVEELSKGMAQKVQFIASILHEPELLILDEPFSGLDPVSQDVFKDEIRQLAASGTSILLSAHQMNMVEALCGRIFMINKGKKVIYGGMDEIKETYADFKCIINGNNKHINFAEYPMVDRVSMDENVSTIYFTKETKPVEFIKCLPEDVDIRELHMDRISLHDIFVSIVRGGIGDE